MWTEVLHEVFDAHEVLTSLQRCSLFGREETLWQYKYWAFRKKRGEFLWNLVWQLKLSSPSPTLSWGKTKQIPQKRAALNACPCLTGSSGGTAHFSLSSILDLLLLSLFTYFDVQFELLETVHKVCMHLNGFMFFVLCNATQLVVNWAATNACADPTSYLSLAAPWWTVKDDTIFMSSSSPTKVLDLAAPFHEWYDLKKIFKVPSKVTCWKPSYSRANKTAVFYRNRLHFAVV